MPKFSVYNDDYSGRHEVALEPVEGDIRINSGGNIERFEFNSWNCTRLNLEGIVTDVLGLQGDVSELLVWKESLKREGFLRNKGMEEKYGDLKEAGEYIDRIRGKIEVSLKMLDDAVELYKEMEKHTKEKDAVFNILNTEDEVSRTQPA